MKDEIKPAVFESWKNDFINTLSEFAPEDSLDFPKFWLDWPEMVDKEIKKENPKGYESEAFLRIRIEKKNCPEWGRWIKSKRNEFAKKYHETYETMLEFGNQADKIQYFQQLKKNDINKFNEELLSLLGVSIAEKLKEK